MVAQPTALAMLPQKKEKRGVSCSPNYKKNAHNDLVIVGEYQIK